MRRTTSQHDASLLDVLIDAFEKNETPDGSHWRELPMPDEAAAVRKFTALVDEARRWKGAPVRHEADGPRRIAGWPDLDVRQLGRGIMVRARAPWFDWWHDRETWAGSPMGPICDWLEEERKLAGGPPFDSAGG